MLRRDQDRLPRHEGRIGIARRGAPGGRRRFEEPEPRRAHPSRVGVALSGVGRFGALLEAAADSGPRPPRVDQSTGRWVVRPSTARQVEPILSPITMAWEVAEMQDADLFMELAGIAGVFVGFGALIAVRSVGASDVFEVVWMRGVVALGLAAALAALAPVVISRYGLTEHEVWALSSILLLVGFVGALALGNLTPEARVAEDPVPTSIKVARFAVWLPSMIVLLLSPIAIALGVAPVPEAALYFTLVALGLFWSAICLLMLVFTGRRPASA